MQNVNNNNNQSASVAASVAASGSSASPAASEGGRAAHRAPLTNGNHEPLWTASHNRVAQPFPASEPCSRVQSPSSTPTPPPSSLSRRCSPLQQSPSVPAATKPPPPWTARGAGAASCSPLGLTLELARPSSAGCGCLSPRILSPPPIGVSAASWANSVAAPQPRSARCASSSPSTSENGPALPPPRRSGASSPAWSWSEAPRPPAGLSHSWGDGSTRSSWNGGGPLGSWFQGSSPSGLNAPAGPQSSVPPKEPEPQELLSTGGGTIEPDRLSTSSSSPPLASWRLTAPPPGPAPSQGQVNWGDPDRDPEEGTCRSQLICAYVGRPLHQQSISPPLFSCHPQPQVQIDLTMAPTPSAPPPSPPQSSGQSSASKQRHQRSSYATTVNLQIGGSGRIKSFSTAQVSLTQTLQGGASAGGAGHTLRRVSINGLSHLPSSLPHS